MLIVHKLLQDKEKDLGNVFQESELLIFCHWRCGNLFQCTPSLCIGILRISVVSCPTATWHSISIRACPQRDCLRCGTWRFSIESEDVLLTASWRHSRSWKDRSVKLSVKKQSEKRRNNTKQQPQQCLSWGTELNPSYIDARTEFFFFSNSVSVTWKDRIEGESLVVAPGQDHHPSQSCTLSEGRARR